MSAATALIVANGDDVFEDLFSASLELQQIATAAGFAARVSFGMARAVAEPHPDVVVLYTATGAFSALQQRLLADAVRSGMGVLAVHASNVLPADSDAFRLMGSRYGSHGPLPHESRFTVHVRPGHPITDGVDEFEIEHEHYRLEFANEPTTLAWRDTADGPESLLHVREEGDGRVAYLQLGHDLRAFGEPAVRTLLANALAWTAREPRPDSSATAHPLDVERNAG